MSLHASGSAQHTTNPAVTTEADDTAQAIIRLPGAETGVRVYQLLTHLKRGRFGPASSQVTGSSVQGAHGVWLGPVSKRLAERVGTSWCRE
jgi:hypothetical protein